MYVYACMCACVHATIIMYNDMCVCICALLEARRHGGRLLDSVIVFELLYVLACHLQSTTLAIINKMLVPTWPL